MKTLLLLERVVIECIGPNKKTAHAISRETSINYEMVLTILRNLMEMRIVSCRNGIYLLDLDSKKDWIGLIGSEETLICESQEILNNLINLKVKHRKEKAFNLKKVYLNEKDFEIFDSLLSSLENFISQKGRNNKTPLKNKIIVHWGYSTYEDLIARHCYI